MRTGFCANVFRPDEMDEALPRLARLGYRSVDLWDGYLAACDLDRLSATLKAVGLAVAQVWPPCDLSGSPEAWKASMDANGRYVALAARLAAGRVGLVTGRPGGTTSASASPAIWEQTVLGLREICRAGKAAGVSYALGAMPGTLADTPEATARLLDEVGEANLAVCLPGPLPPDSGARTVELLGARTVALHAQNWRGRVRTYLAAGDRCAFGEFLAALAAAGFDGTVSVAHAYHRQRWEVAAHEAGYLKGLLQTMGVAAPKRAKGGSKTLRKGAGARKGKARR